MKKLLPYILCFIFFSCSTLNVEKVIKSETSYFDVNGKVKKIIEKKFLIDKSESKPLWETHIKFDSKNRIVSLREHRIYMDIETGEYELMEPSITQYIYNGNKVKEVQFHTYGTTENYENDIEPEYLSIISYNYLESYI